MDNSSQNSKISGNIFSQKFNFSAVNPFSGDYDPSKAPEIKPAENNTTTNPVKRLNGYDCNILNQTNFEGTPDNTEELSIDYRIKDKEALVKDLEAKIKIADNYGTQNEALGLKAKRQRLLQELDSLRKQQLYGGRVLGESTPQVFHESFKQKMPFIYKVQAFISRQILAKISKKVNSVVTLTDSLEQLSQISKSVDELVDMNVPYGEKVQSYEKLTEYLNQANLIHSKISKSLGKKG
jgi:hypothetical protein